MSNLKRLPLHPFIFCVYPILALLAHNLGEIKTSVATRSLVISLIGGMLLWLLLRLLLRNWQRAALVTSLLLILFYSYGHIYSYLERIEIFGLLFGRHRLLLPIWLFMAIGGSWWIIRKLQDLSNATMAFNVIGIALLAFPVVQMASYEIRSATAMAKAPLISAEETGLQVKEGQAPPDIYYIILDAYSREDVLKNVLGYDNSTFLNKLSELGFYVARCSQSNYAQTELSLASSLNFDYLPALGDSFIKGSTDRSGLWPLLRHGKVRQVLEENGYTIVAFETGFSWSQMEDADIYMSPEAKALSELEKLQALSGFETMLIKTTGGLALTDAASSLPKFLVPDMNSPKKRHRERILYTLDKIKNIQSAIKSPKFVFAHVVAPHFPYVLGPEGQEVVYPEKIDAETYRIAYTDQITYLNQRVAPLVRQIIDNSATPPIIIIQADHGHDRATPTDRMRELNAYYLPGQGRQLLYETITPVNTFRVIFNAYFGGSFDLLEDASYYSTYLDPYTFQVIPNTSTSCEGN